MAIRFTETPTKVGKRIIESAKEAAQIAKGKAKPARSFNSAGRPLEKDRHLANEQQKPWLTEGMSRATWYRRQKEKRDA